MDFSKFVVLPFAKYKKLELVNNTEKQIDNKNSNNNSSSSNHTDDDDHRSIAGDVVKQTQYSEDGSGRMKIKNNGQQPESSNTNSSYNVQHTAAKTLDTYSIPHPPGIRDDSSADYDANDVNDVDADSSYDYDDDESSKSATTYTINSKTQNTNSGKQKKSKRDHVKNYDDAILTKVHSNSKKRKLASTSKPPPPKKKQSKISVKKGNWIYF